MGVSVRGSSRTSWALSILTPASVLWHRRCSRSSRAGPSVPARLL